MLKSLNALQLDADALIRSYHSWQAGALHQWTDTKNGPKTLVELHGLRSNAQQYANSAREILARTGADALAADIRADLVAIAEEMESGIVEIDEVADPDVVWPKLDRQKKLEVTQRLYAADDRVQAIRARLQGRRRGETRKPA